ncbi:UTP--glucose-1-phosphate uridylyltransferase [Salipiger aestuarii]|uniref:UTP--glucose-1-phosphate uridylyltransferase n=1 Tax=Salipiger aestuarii TaxID=568098 RepID=A0A327XPI3_9RHOB|nr:UTP--glucose-1-phosphate uridylyltransferase [Salipiger aestuarii]EIE52542.1 UTP-glucose-1-phosphate uridylyltransferase [Citreicella sp. 357]KAA8605132.1 UTP--glucose-1-phosphate uridylyltransferase [Salipiger aestuarii]KAA8606958.1 UTP--glucose-1-phosphate uridylyltransferase [Salipiger aestuarii]KAB2539075.1 UTP--glucose-1-phosphate uridylyltransferase [Salipiger aestuarii]RAK09957.1 UTP--glucose-1-phosphate uridylyltransferase [Salipiger aestuarii]
MITPSPRVRQKVRTAIFPVAGLGTRFLPATKATPKELLPVLDKPLLQFAMDEAREAGIERMIFVSHPSKSAIERYVHQDDELCDTLRSKGKHGIADRLDSDAIDPKAEQAHFVMQPEPLGLGHAVLCAADDVLPGPVAVILPDDLIVGETGCIKEMIEAYEAGGPGHMVATMEVARSEVSAYGVLDPIGNPKGKSVNARGMVEKPDADEAPSLHAVVGRYVLDASIFDDLRSQKPGMGGEIQLTDAIAKGIDRVGLCGFRFSGQRFDCGNKAGMLRATLAFAGRRPEFHSVLSEHASLAMAAE